MVVRSVVKITKEIGVESAFVDVPDREDTLSLALWRLLRERLRLTFVS